MVAIARKKSFDELYRAIRDLPEGQRGEILAPGELHVTMGRPGKKHRRAAQALYVGLASRDANVGGTGSWIELEPEVRFGERLFDPDLAGWRVDRVAELPDETRPICPLRRRRTRAQNDSVRAPATPCGPTWSAFSNEGTACQTKVEMSGGPPR
jgi:hypothetical protein